ncbi:class I SAM-dependent methyltransferase [Erythrobacter sp. EC-HK427]|uniref:class I SAM-dependent methyltransferase n=1 Tax=Erythrobacter sp. EC-HK427 TaxID=2038396 RepID=UPI00125309EF|nr:class I SAM-dependent methyltransferase [Erythrobacter sp. EC-HK427]VVS97228.1 Methyltransferase domain-containing protein [Erythrobacter sp. EC-HK427]
MGEATSYDAVEYPASSYPTTHPSHLAALAALHGLAAPDPQTCRVLEIAGGDGINLAAMAAGLPQAHFTSFDLSTAAVERGRRVVAAAGLTNVDIVLGDLLDWADGAEGQYDYIIAHGLYAWVPESVRAAMWRLVARVLAPEGIAFVSYNAQPGGYLRMAVRDMLLHALDGLEGDARMAKAHAVLQAYSTQREGERLTQQALRAVAEPMALKNDGSLFHDELGECYAPQSLVQMASAAGSHGLAFLNDALPKMVTDGLPGEALDDAEVVRAAQASDYEAVTFFHQSLFVREGRAPCRVVDPAAFGHLLASAKLERKSATEFVHEEGPFEIDDAAMADFLGEMAAAWPERLPLARFAGDAEKQAGVLELYQNGLVQLHAAPFPGTTAPGDAPEASALVRAQVALGAPILFSLDMRVVTMPPGPRHFLSLMDGTRSREQLAADWGKSEFDDQVSADDAIAQLAKAGLVLS